MFEFGRIKWDEVGKKLKKEREEVGEKYGMKFEEPLPFEELDNKIKAVLGIKE